MASRCKIEFDREDEVFYSGETIEGKVTLTTAKAKDIESISVGLFGECKIKWEETVDVDEHGTSATIGRNVLWSRKTLADELIELHGPGVLEADTYCWYFDFKLGSNFLTSIESKLGYVRYEVYVTIQRLERYDNEFVKPISVIKHFDLNSNPSYREPLLSEVTVKTCCWIVTRGNAFCSLSTPFSAYAPGQDIRYNLDVRNRSRKRIQGFRIELVRKTTFIAKHPRLSENVIESQMAVNFWPEDITSDYNIPGAFTIPPTPPTTYGGGLIAVDYILRARGVVACCFSSDLYTELRIIIGTIPIRESLSIGQFFLPSDMRIDCIPEGQDAAAVLPFVEYEIRPPSYGVVFPTEPQFVDGDPTKSYRPILGFRPLYPVYNKR